VALEAARCGATVALLGRRQDKLEAAYDAITAAGGPKPAMIPLDLAAAGPTEYESLVQLLRRELHRLDGIVHCAAHFVPLGPLAGQTQDQWSTLFKVNLIAPFALTRACLALLQAAPDSSVVFVGETHGAKPLALLGRIRRRQVRASGARVDLGAGAGAQGKAEDERLHPGTDRHAAAHSRAIPARITAGCVPRSRPRAPCSISSVPKA
jgi:NAD(P)-dependent dehydrogenase (short-subunit alcohol dehydrogenase family)